ncbi:MAG: hypothetical protein AAB225_20745 [Acidobacteriota bacterium]
MLAALSGIGPCDDFPAMPLFEELLREKHLLIADHTRRHLRREITFPGPVIDRANRARWLKDGALTLAQRAAREVSRLPQKTKAELTRLMQREARRSGMPALADRDSTAGE